LAFNGTVSNMNMYQGKNEFAGNKSWWGAAVYANYDPTEKLGFTLRLENFSDKNGLKYAGLAGDGGIFATTLSAQLKAGNLIVIPEFRVDAANKAIFTKGDGASTKTTANALVAAVYQF
jgi:hypothetical protein